MPLKDFLIPIADNIQRHKEMLNDDNLSLTDRLLIQLIVDVNYLRWESLGEFISDD